MFTQRPEGELLPHLPRGPVEGLPLRVVPDWRKQVRRATGVCRLIDRHMDDAGRSLPRWTQVDISLRLLCPEQRVQMITDVYAAICRRK